MVLLVHNGKLKHRVFKSHGQPLFLFNPFSPHKILRYLWKYKRYLKRETPFVIFCGILYDAPVIFNG